MRTQDQMLARQDYAYTQVISDYTTQHGGELSSVIQGRLRSIHELATTQSKTASDYHGVGMAGEVLLAAETKGRIEALEALGFISIRGVES